MESTRPKLGRDQFAIRQGIGETRSGGIFFLKQKKVGGVLFCQRKGVIFAKGSLNDGLLAVFRFGLLC